MTPCFFAPALFFIHGFDAINPVAYLPQSKRLLEQVREVLRYKHYSLRTEQAYLYWIRFYVRWHGRNGEMQHTQRGLPLEEFYANAFTSEVDKHPG